MSTTSQPDPVYHELRPDANPVRKLPGDKAPLTTFEGFSIGSAAAVSAVLATNPMEVAKTRMQLQGELQKAVASDGKPAQKQFHNFVDCLRKTYHAEGIRGLQRGLGVAAVYQVAMNGARLGTYEPLRQTFNSLMGLRPDETYASTALLAGATSGAIGATLGNPFYLVKARMQAYSPVFDIGKQKRHYKNGLDALRTIVHLDGFRGLARGVTSNILRTASGSTVQLPSYNWAKSYLATLNPHANPYNPLNVLAGDQHPFLTMLSCSAFAGGVVLAVMQPMDVVLTRVSNQPTHVDPKSGFRVGSLYSGPIDALVKIAKSEGFRGYYKGSAAHFFRIAPHTILTLSLNDVYLNLYKHAKTDLQTYRDHQTQS